jgi:phospholipid/cholesterol/gamma-HCH transport system ATP-binding protein
MTESEPLIEVRGLDAVYGDTRVLEDVSLKVFPGEVFVIIGGSGCGKTTLLKHMAGLIRPAAGQVLYRGQPIEKMDDDTLAKVQQGIGIAFQGGALFNSLTVGENVALPMRESGKVDSRLIPALVRLKLGMVGLAGAGHRMPSELSGGMRKRAGLARAIAIDPPVVYFDEPSAGLDPIMAAGLDTLILNLRSLLGITFIIVTHELDSIRAIADRILMLDMGRVVFLGTLGEAEESEVPRLRQFFDRQPDEFITQRNI